MNDEANRLIAEALGETGHLRKWCGDDEGELCLEEPNQEQPRSSCSHLANGGTWETCSSKRAFEPPDFCGNDNDALDAIKELALPGREINVQHNIICGEHSLRFFKGKRGEECQVPFYDELSEGRGKTLAAALKDAMVEIIKVGCERAPACPGACDPCEKATANIRIRPAVEAAVKGGE